MRTGRLIGILGTNIEPVESGRVRKALAWALAFGGAAAFCAMVMTIGFLTDGADGIRLSIMAPKLLFTLSLAGMGAVLLNRSMRPGQDKRKLLTPIFLPLLAAGLIGVAAGALQHSADWSSMIGATRWAACLICIPLLAILPFGALIWASRDGAPTNLRRTGAIAGFVAGALAAAAYALHGSVESLPFIAIWYSAPIALCAFIGAMLGPRLLRW